MFFELDRDGSGYIDSNEWCFSLKRLSVNMRSNKLAPRDIEYLIQ